MSLRRFARHCCPLRMSLSPRFLSVLLEGHQQANMRCMCRETKPWMVLSKCGYQVTVETWAQQTNSWISSFWSGNHKVVGRSLDEIASFSWFNLRVSGESGQGLLSRGFAELQRRAFERWENNPGRPGTQGFGRRNVVSSYHLPDELDEWGINLVILNVASKRSAWLLFVNFQGLLKRTGLKLSAAWSAQPQQARFSEFSEKKTSTSEETYIIQWKPWHDDRFDSWEKDVYDSTHSRDRTDIILDRRA